MPKVIAIVRYQRDGVPVSVTCDATDKKMSIHMQALIHWLHAQAVPFTVTYKVEGATP